MATLTGDKIQQRFIDLPNGERIGIHVVTAVGAIDSFTVPDLANTTSEAAVKHLRRYDQDEVALTTSGNVVSIVGTKGETYVLVSLHARGNRNYHPETSSEVR
jgi:hypothetical protein